MVERVSFLLKTVFSIQLALFSAGMAAAQDPNVCDQPGEAPDLVVSDIVETRRFGNVSGITAFSLGSDSCNDGTCRLNVFASNSQHPVFAQNMFRLKDGKLEQIGQSWAAHRFIALADFLCSQGCIATVGTYLGVQCSTRDLAVYAGGQQQLGRRSEVNATTGVFQFPPTGQGDTGDAIFRRLQVHDSDLDPALNTGALYFVEGVSVSADDAAGENQHNNASYRPIDVLATDGDFDIVLIGATQAGNSAIQAWAAHDPDVLVVSASADGLFLVGSRATPRGDGTWHYEYVVQNLSSHRSAGQFEVTLPVGACYEPCSSQEPG